ncbi:MAG: hypothetical protein PWP45_373, partial [Tepidanaerobacteraceae bacterium]|nr:hypothetical protein [Tepidanaerobacteraceae bacterium]
MIINIIKCAKKKIYTALARGLIAVVTGNEVRKGMVTIQAKLIFQSSEDKQEVLDLMRRWSSCARFAYNRLLEGKSRNELKRELQGIFNLNSRYVDDAIMKAKSV